MPLGIEAIKIAANEIGVHPAALAAVADVESTGEGFLPSGLPKILFEAHVFWKQLQKIGIDPKAIQEAAPHICQPTWSAGRKYYVGGQREWERMWAAQKFDIDAAYASASWGLFQLMGFNWRAAGFDHIRDFVIAHKRNEEEHLRAICRWMKSNGLAARLANLNWRTFALGYNGPGQVELYATRLERAYRRRLLQDWG